MQRNYKIRSSFGDASDQELLAEEHIDQVDLFIAVTNDDEANIMSAMLAKRMGAKKVMVLIQRRAYVDLVQGSVIDIAISPQQATISALLSHVRKADIVGVSSLRRGVAEAIEAVAHGDETTSRVVGRSIDEIKLPPGTIIGAVVRGNDVMIANDNLRIEQGDHVIMFLTDKSLLPTSSDYSSQVLSSCNNLGANTAPFYFLYFSWSNKFSFRQYINGNCLNIC